MAPPPPLTRSPSPALAGEARGTLRPLAGFWFLNELLEEQQVTPIRFRPLAGFWFLNYRRFFSEWDIVPKSFRPLAGFWFLNARGRRSIRARSSVFPSPCGVLVLKSG